MNRTNGNINILETEYHHFNYVIDLLYENISKYKPHKNEYFEVWRQFKSQNNAYSVVAIINDKVIGYGSVLIEKKIRGGLVGHIEDIVTHSRYRRLGVASRIMDNLHCHATQLGCYKLTLACSELNEEFYIKNGYEREALCMTKKIKRNLK